MAALVQDIIVEQCATFTLELEVTDSSGDPYDFTGCSAAAQIRLNFLAEDALLSFSSTPSEDSPAITLADGALTLTASAAATTDLDFRQGVYDINLTVADGKVYRLMRGRAWLSPAATR